MLPNYLLLYLKKKITWALTYQFLPFEKTFGFELAPRDILI